MVFEIYGRNNCQSCENAKTLLKDYGYEFEFFNIEEQQMYLEDFKFEWPGRKTVPAISFNNERIGGYEDLREWVSKHSTNE